MNKTNIEIKQVQFIYFVYRNEKIIAEYTKKDNVLYLRVFRND